MTSPDESLLVRTCRGERTERVPVWFMRQAGRYHPVHRELYEKHGVRGLTTNPELNARVVTLPVEELGVDAAVMYADIILPLEDMGMAFEYGAGDRGPIFEHPIRTPQDVRELRPLDPERGVPYILEAIRETRRRLTEPVPVIGFSGGPFTLAAYMIEGGASRSFTETKRFIHTHPRSFHQLMDLLTDSITTYLHAQVDRGINVAQLFETWAGVLDREDYGEFVHPYNRRILEQLSVTGVPSILFIRESAHLLDYLLDAGADVVGVDWRVSLPRLARVSDGETVVMGNLDPATVLAPPEAVNEKIDRLLRQAVGFRGHVFNLGHRVPNNADPDRLRAIVDRVHEQSSRDPGD